MIFSLINDYELLYLIKEGNEKAYEVMIEKYKPFIKKMSYRFYSFYNDDFLYDGYLVLNEAIMKFDDRYSKSFLKFYELLLARYFCKYVKKNMLESLAIKEYEYSYTLRFNERSIYDIRVELAKREIYKIKDETLKKILIEYFYSCEKISDICQKYNYNVKKVYNKINGIKNKLNK